MIEPQTLPTPERVCVSIFERIVPFASLALAAIGAGIGVLPTASVIIGIPQREVINAN